MHVRRMFRFYIVDNIGLLDCQFRAKMVTSKATCSVVSVTNGTAMGNQAPPTDTLCILYYNAQPFDWISITTSASSFEVLIGICVFEFDDVSLI